MQIFDLDAVPRTIYWDGLPHDAVVWAAYGKVQVQTDSFYPGERARLKRMAVDRRIVMIGIFDTCVEAERAARAYYVRLPLNRRYHTQAGGGWLTGIEWNTVIHDEC
jgi:hypothetical protein